ncbi:hypothetical protein F0562_025120 [Nyssa sinensis]|uniref:Centromere protein Mis12 n=1 Tax=Nyssa sinensis TaxID=561372 RepID=A0A5J5BEJ6_9ASTE|nr:hypothetical protein F0562_025120 [Nyssa sinensis]
MEGSESEAIFDSFNLNPQLFINEVLNGVDDLVDEAFDYFHREASTLLKVEGTDRSDDLRKGVNYIRNMIQTVLDERLAMWQKYCLRHCFSVPEGFSLSKANESPGDSLMDHDALGDPELDAQLDSLRDKLTLVGNETAELNRELRALERQSVVSSCCAGSVNEAFKLYEQHHEMFQELTRTASEIRMKMGKLKTKMVEQTECSRKEWMHMPNIDMCMMKGGKGLSNATLEELHKYIADIKNV